MVTVSAIVLVLLGHKRPNTILWMSKIWAYRYNCSFAMEQRGLTTTARSQ